ncbi:MAG: hypothetical protein ABIC82_05780 [bacterium]
MIKSKLQLKEADDYLKLAKIYHDIAKCRDNKKEHWRGVVDANYNSAELCVKGLLKLKMLEIPSSHGGVVRKFSQYYIFAEEFQYLHVRRDALQCVSAKCAR